MSRRVKEVLKKISDLESALAEANQELKVARSNQRFRCACGKVHRIGDMVAIMRNARNKGG